MNRNYVEAIRQESLVSGTPRGNPAGLRLPSTCGFLPSSINESSTAPEMGDPHSLAEMGVAGQDDNQPVRCKTPVARRSKTLPAETLSLPLMRSP